MWPGIHPRIGLPLLVLFSASYGWFLAELHPRTARWWWLFIAVLGLVALVGTVVQWRRNAQVADALARGSHPDPAVAERVDRIARYVDDHPRSMTWGLPIILLVVGVPGIPAAVHRGDFLFAIPCAGLLIYEAVVVVLFRRRRRQVEAWLGERPREPGWRSVPPS